MGAALHHRVVPLHLERNQLTIGAPEGGLQAAQAWAQARSNVREVVVVPMLPSVIAEELRALNMKVATPALTSVERKVVAALVEVAIPGGSDLFLLPGTSRVEMIGKINGGERHLGYLERAEYENQFIAGTVTNKLGAQANYNVSQSCGYEASFDGVNVSCRLRTQVRSQRRADGDVGPQTMINFRIHPDQRDLPLPNELGIRLDAIDALTRVLRDEKLPTVVSGDPGTGKTTLLYSLLRSIASKLIYTFESPIEMLVEPLIQRQYASIDEVIGDREALLQMLPELVFVGEALGPTAFEPLMQFIETGVATVTTLHERTGLWALYRGKQLGGDRFLTKVGLMWCQALISRACESCATQSAPSDAVKHRFELHKRELPEWTWKRNPGTECPECHGLGVRGPRRPLVEFFHLNEEIRKMARASTWNPAGLREIAYKDPTKHTIAEQGADALATGEIDERDYLRLGDDLL
jgi:Tfp pilus assembly pilus retraction ATPase PilT